MCFVCYLGADVDHRLNAGVAAGCCSFTRVDVLCVSETDLEDQFAR